MAKYSLETYNIDVVNTGFDRTSEIFDFQDLSYTFVLNGPGYMSFALPINSPAADPGVFLQTRTQIHIKRNGGTTRWFGPLEDIDVDWEDLDGTVNFTAKTYLQHLKYKITDRGVVYNEQDASLIASDLISDVQARTNGELNITDGTLETVGDTTDTLNYQEVLDAMLNQSDNIVGYDFDLMPTLDGAGLITGVELNIYKGKGRLLDNLPAVTLQSTEGGSGSKYKEFYNQVTFLSAGTGDQVIAATASNPSSQQAYTRKEIVFKSSENLSVNNLQAAADSYINESSVPQSTVQLKLNSSVYPVGSINVGDILKLNIYKENTFLDFRGTARVIELTVQVDNEGKETIIPRLQFYN